MPSKISIDLDLDESNLLLPAVIDLRAQAEPNKLFCALLNSANVQDGLVNVSYSDYANAINRCSWWLEEKLGKGDGLTLKTIGYFGPPDIRQTIVALAVSKINHKALLLSSRNSAEGILRLLDACDCHNLIVAQDWPALTPVVNVLTSKKRLQVLPFEGIAHWLDHAKVLPYLFDTTLEKDASRPCVILHSSGSTGFPKPVVYTFGALASYRTFLEPQEVIAGAKRTMVDLWKNKMVGFLCGTAFNVYWGMTPIFGPGTVVPTPKLAAAIHQLEICKSTVLPVSVLEPLASVPEYLEGLRSLELAIWCGSPFSSSIIPNKIRSLVPINAGYGATEAGPFITQVESQDDFEYMSFSPLMGARFQPYENNLYEMIIEKKPELQGAQHIFCSFPELSEWHSKDLFSKHATKPDLWRYEGRTDDILVLSTGGNINPLFMEGVLMTHPKVISALLVGEGRPETAWLIEVCDPPQNVVDSQALVEELWSTIEKANDEAHVRIEAKVRKSNIVFVTKEKPMLRAAKGSIQRKATIRAYRGELDALYTYGQETGKSVHSNWEFTEDTPLRSALELLAQELCGWPYYPMTNSSGSEGYQNRADGRGVGKYNGWGGGVNHFDARSPLFGENDAHLVHLSTLGLALTISGVTYIGYEYGWINILWLSLIYTIPIQPCQSINRKLGHMDTRGAAATIDREFGFIGHYFLHDIVETHVLHHTVPTIPHYHAREATEAIKRVMGEHYKSDTKNGAFGFLASMWQNIRWCQWVEPCEGAVGDGKAIWFYRNSNHLGVPFGGCSKE
ncbi:hypothetical protein NHQ30_007961 [Ciborinia camelliae]|nr:hypothetical protein NHQ30_007961 [Ciborinia camelliae]